MTPQCRIGCKIIVYRIVQCMVCCMVCCIVCCIVCSIVCCIVCCIVWCIMCSIVCCIVCCIVWCTMCCIVCCIVCCRCVNLMKMEGGENEWNLITGLESLNILEYSQIFVNSFRCSSFQAYLTEFAYGSATTDDLWRVLTEVGDN